MFRREWVESHIRSSGENGLINWQWNAVVRIAGVCQEAGLGKEPWEARQTVKSWMCRVNAVCRAPFLLSVCPNKRAPLSAMRPPIQCFCRRISKKKLLTRKIFVKFSCRPRTDGKKVSFYKWGVKYRKRGQKGENDLGQRKKADQKVWKGSKKRLIFGAGKEKIIKYIICGIKTKRETR